MKVKSKNNPIIELKEVSKGYKSGKNILNALKDINFTARRGELVLVLGPSGSGKTTFLSIIAGLIEPTTGTAILYGGQINSFKNKAMQKFRAENIGFVFQNFMLIDSLSVIENIMLAEKFAGAGRKQARATAIDTLDKLKIGHLASKFPKELSQGEKQRAAVGRAVVNNAELILADEPTASLDTENGLEVIRLLHKYAENGACVLIASHDHRIKDYADRVLRIEDGRLFTN